MNLAAAIKNELLLKQLTIALVLVVPYIVSGSITGNESFLHAGLAAACFYIASDRGGLAPCGVLLQAAFEIALFLAFMWSLTLPIVFVLLTAASAVGALGISRFGKELRSLGNFIFIPVLYIACELSEGLPRDQLTSVGLGFVPYLLLAAIPALIISATEHVKDRRPGTSLSRHMLRLLKNTSFSSPSVDWPVALWSIGTAVAISTAWVEFSALPFGQWVIWSAASVITGQIASSRQKILYRVSGVLLGVPAGIGIGLLLPHTEISYAIATVLSILTLVAFKTYLIGFATRSMFVSVALTVAGGSALVALDRISNVIVGGLIGILCLFFFHLIIRRGRREHSNKLPTAHSGHLEHDA